MNMLTPMMIVVLLAGGMGVALLGSIKVSLATKLKIDEAKIGGLISLFGLTLIPVILTAGFLADHVGRQVVFTGGVILYAASLLVLASVRRYPAALVAVVLMSAGWSLMANVGNVLTPLAFPGTAAFATNLANVFFGIGAFVTPLICAVLIRRVSLAVALACLSAWVALPAVMSLGVDFATLAPAADAADAPTITTSALLGDRFLWLCGMAFFFYSPIEASLGAWTTTYLGEQGVRPDKASGLLSAFWLMYMASRLAAAFLLPAGSEGLAIVVLAVAGAATLVLMVLVRTPTLAASLIVAAGLVLGPIFPTLLALLLDHFPPALHGRAVGVLFATGGIGWTVIPMILGAVAGRIGIRRALIVAAVAALGLVGVAVLLNYAASTNAEVDTNAARSVVTGG